MINYNILSKLDKKQISGFSIKKSKSVSILKKKSGYNTFTINYFIKNNKGYRKIGFSFLDRAFTEIDSIILYNDNLEEFAVVTVKQDTPVEKLVEGFYKFVTENSRSTISNFSESILSEGEKFNAFAQWVGSSSRNVIMVLSGILLFVNLILFFVTKFRKFKDEYQSINAAEAEINRSLFSGQTGDEPEFELYSEISKYLKFVLSNNNSKGIIICGPPGTSKTYMVRRELYFSRLRPKSDYFIMKGSSLGIEDTYEALYRAKDKILILDDFDTPLADPDTVNLLKAATDSYTRRVLSISRKSTINTGDNQETEYTPRSFVFTGKIIIITNLFKKDIDKALMSRMPVVEVNFDTKTVVENIEKMLKYFATHIPIEMKQEVYDYIIKIYSKNKDIKLSFRTFQNAFDARYNVPDDWKNIVNTILGV